MAVALGLATPDDATAKQQKRRCRQPNQKCGKKGCCKPGQVCAGGKCQRPCVFAETATTWTLTASCATQQTITIPDGVTLDGAGRTITFTGPITAYQRFTSGQFTFYPGLLAQNGTVAFQDLKLRLDQMRCPADMTNFNAIQFESASGTVVNTTVTSTSRQPSCQKAVATNTATPQHLDVSQLAVRFRTGTAVNIVGPVSGTLTDSTITGSDYGVLLGGSTMAVTDSTITDVGVLGIEVYDTNVAETNQNLIEGNTIRGRNRRNDSNGILVRYSGDATITGNAVAGYECGIRLWTNAGDVTLGANTFPPPGNDLDIDDPRP